MRENERFLSSEEFRQKIGKLFYNGQLIPGNRLASLFHDPDVKAFSSDELNSLVLFVLQKITTISFEDQANPKTCMDKKQQGLFYYYFGKLTFEKAAEKADLSPFQLRNEQRKLIRYFKVILSSFKDTPVEGDIDIDTISNGKLIVNTDSGFSVSIQQKETEVTKENELVSPDALKKHGWRSVSSITRGSEEGEKKLALRGFRGASVKTIASFFKNQGIRIIESTNTTNNGITCMVAPEDIEKAKSLLRSVTLK